MWIIFSFITTNKPIVGRVMKSREYERLINVKVGETGLEVNRIYENLT